MIQINAEQNPNKLLPIIIICAQSLKYSKSYNLSGGRHVSAVHGSDIHNICRWQLVTDSYSMSLWYLPMANSYWGSSYFIRIAAGKSKLTSDSCLYANPILKI